MVFYFKSFSVILGAMQFRYELMLVLSTSAAKDKEEQIYSQIEKQIKKPGKIETKTNLGVKKLAYPIKKEGEGIYCLLTLSLTSKEAKELTNKLKLNELILRYLLIRRK